MTTTSALEKKSNSSPNLSQLTFYPDFFDFYVANKAAVDTIISAQLTSLYWKYRHCIEQSMEEIRSDVLMLLHSRNVLRQYDPQKSALNTFITGRVNGYIRHIITKNIEQNRRWTRVLVKGLNAGVPDHQELLDGEIGREYEPETSEDIVEKISQQLDEDSQKILRMKVIDELNNVQIAKILDKTPPCICIKSKKIRDVAQRVLTPSKKKEPASNHIQRTRCLTALEKKRIREAFSKYNGILPDDYWTHFPAAKTLSIFQITGYVTSLHKEVAKGTLKINDFDKYQELRRQRRALWVTYNSERYKTMQKKMCQKGML